MKPRVTAFNKRACNLVLNDALNSLKSEKDVETFVQTILLESERIMVGNRLFIAAMLRKGENYDSIMQTLGVGMSTITSVKKALGDDPGRFDTILERVNKRSYERREILARKYRSFDLGTWEHFFANFRHFVKY